LACRRRRCMFKQDRDKERWVLTHTRTITSLRFYVYLFIIFLLRSNRKPNAREISFAGEIEPVSMETAWLLCWRQIALLWFMGKAQGISFIMTFFRVLLPSPGEIPTWHFPAVSCQRGFSERMDGRSTDWSLSQYLVSVHHPNDWIFITVDIFIRLK
jgi:hypothetical protein